MKQKFQDWRPTGDSKERVEQCVQIVEEYQAQGLTLTLRSKGNFHVIKLALTMEQIAQYNPPPNPAKMSDSRATKYVAEHGAHSWGVDALEPRVLQDLVNDAFKGIVDQERLQHWIDREEKDKARLRKALENF